MKDTYLLDNYSINFKGNLLNLNTPIVMSILNTTPDSFFDGGNYNSLEGALKKVEKDLESGATIIDIGGYSTKPNGHEVSLEEEIKRTIPYIEAIIKRFPNVNLSIDTFRGKVASLALQAGAGMINDISAWNIDNEMIKEEHRSNILGQIWAKGERISAEAAVDFINQKENELIIPPDVASELKTLVKRYTTRR